LFSFWFLHPDFTSWLKGQNKLIMRIIINKRRLYWSSIAIKQKLRDITPQQNVIEGSKGGGFG